MNIPIGPITIYLTTLWGIPPGGITLLSIDILVDGFDITLCNFCFGIEWSP